MKKILALAFALLLAASASTVAEPTVPAKQAVATNSTPAAETKTAPIAMAKPVNINIATEAELKTIPGVGDACARRIIAGRPYATTDQLISKKIVFRSNFDKIKNRMTAGLKAGL